jgi:glucosylceramidase
MVTAAQNPDGSIAVVIFNPNEEKKESNYRCREKSMEFAISGKAIQTIVIPGDKK